MLCVISWCSGLELLYCASHWVSPLHWPRYTRAWGSRLAFGNIWRLKGKHRFFSALLLAAASDSRLQVTWDHPGTCTGGWLATPFVCCGKQCPYVPPVKQDSAPGLGSWSTASSLIRGFSGEDEPVPSLELHKMIHLGLPSPTAMSLCHAALMSWDCSLCPHLGCCHESREQRVARGEKAKLPHSHYGLGRECMFFSAGGLCP